MLAILVSASVSRFKPTSSPFVSMLNSLAVTTSPVHIPILQTAHAVASIGGTTVPLSKKSSIATTITLILPKDPSIFVVDRPPLQVSHFCQTSLFNIGSVGLLPAMLASTTFQINPNSSTISTWFSSPSFFLD